MHIVFTQRLVFDSRINACPPIKYAINLSKISYHSFECFSFVKVFTHPNFTLYAMQYWWICQIYFLLYKSLCITYPITSSISAVSLVSTATTLLAALFITTVNKTQV